MARFNQKNQIAPKQSFNWNSHNAATYKKEKKNIENAKAPLGIEPTTFNQMIASKFTLRRFDSFKQSLYTRKNY